MDIESPSAKTPTDTDFFFDYLSDGPAITSKGRNDLFAEPVLDLEVHKIDLGHFIPLGCFTFPVGIEKHLNVTETDPRCESHGEWTEIKDFLPSIDNPQVPWKSLADLWRAHWIRIEQSPPCSCRRLRTWRLHVLPDDVARNAIDRSSQRLRRALAQVLEIIDTSLQTWSDGPDSAQPQPFQKWSASDDRSLYYLFNTLPSPDPSVHGIKDRYERFAMEELLSSGTKLHGLLTPLYPYQRRSTALMLQREVSPRRQLDPRLELRTAPDGQAYYYGARDRIFLRHPRYYDSIRGGILSETMGLGKTLMVLALILATKDHWPKTPPLYTISDQTIRPQVGSLLDLSAATASNHAIPWRRFFEDLKIKEGLEMQNCVTVMEKQVPTYEIPPVPVRTSRRLTFCMPSEKVRLCHGTIIVVPRNLMHQWRSELSKHVQADVLKVLVMENSKVMLPPAEELVTYDIILFSRTRFEFEAKKGVECDWYKSPLEGLHWLRIVIDEGHNFCSSNTNAAFVADRLIRAERKWIVSGTPARDLLGVETDVEALTFDGDHEGAQLVRQASLEQRKSFNASQEAVSGAVKSLGALATRFFKCEPWATAASADSVRWEDYVYRHEAYTGRTFSGFSTCFRQVLEEMVIKTRPQDVECDLELPPLTHTIVRLEPSFFDKLTANLFVQLFASNAVTSERSDIDYLFHKGSQMHLHRLIANLRQSGFFWTGFKPEAVAATIEVCEKYLAKPDNDKMCNPEDIQLLHDCIEAARIALECPSWNALSQTTEMGIFMQDWPLTATEAWSLDDCICPMMIGLTEAVRAQNFVNNTLVTDETASGLAQEGLSIKRDKQAQAEASQKKPRGAADTVKMIKQGVPSSSIQSNTTRLGFAGVKSPNKSLKPIVEKAAMSPTSPGLAQNDSTAISEKRKRSSNQRLSTADTSITLPSTAPLGRTAVVGTTSAKFSYIIDRIYSLYREEKILIFFDENHQAYYLSQVLDLLHIKHLIYANTLTSEQRGKYIVLFNTDDNQRILLMDIKQASHGLNVCSASRVFFLNPVCSPSVEAQAMKRAHRIGQTKAVHVETLVLRHTIEEAMFERAAKMTRNEHMHAAKFLEDDASITRIIQQARVMPISQEERKGMGQMAPLKTPQQIFGRPGRGGHKASGLEKELFGHVEKFEGEGFGSAAAGVGNGVKKRRRDLTKVQPKTSATHQGRSVRRGKGIVRVSTHPSRGLAHPGAGDTAAGTGAEDEDDRGDTTTFPTTQAFTTLDTLNSTSAIGVDAGTETYNSIFGGGNT